MASARIERILRLYPDDCQPQSIAPFQSPESFSGASLWRVETARGPLALRCWPTEHPKLERLEFIQAVLWHVDQEGFHRVPVPVETEHKHGYVRHDGHLWELVPWLPGEPTYRKSPSPRKLENALLALAEFHRAAASFPLPETGPIRSPGLSERARKLKQLLTGGLASLEAAVGEEDTDDSLWPELAPRARRLIALATQTGPKIQPTLEIAASLAVSIQPCIRDVWHAHVLYTGDKVSGLVDFGAMRAENVTSDVARLLGSLAGNSLDDWHTGLAAYQAGRPLSSDERALLAAFDKSAVVMGGLQWLEWIYVERRQFANQAAVMARIDEFLARLELIR